MGTFAKLVRRAVETDASVMVKIQELLRGATNVLLLAQGVVYWQPPESAMNIEKIIRESAVNKYGSDDGLPELREALLEKGKSWCKELQTVSVIFFAHPSEHECGTSQKDPVEHDPFHRAPTDLCGHDSSPSKKGSSGA